MTPANVHYTDPAIGTVRVPVFGHSAQAATGAAPIAAPTVCGSSGLRAALDRAIIPAPLLSRHSRFGLLTGGGPRHLVPVVPETLFLLGAAILVRFLL